MNLRYHKWNRDNLGDNFSLNEHLLRLAKPRSGFIRNVRLAENAVAGYSFANGFVNRPEFAGAADREDLAPIDVSGHAKTPNLALEILLMEAAERHCAVFTGEEPLVTGTAAEFDPERRFETVPPNASVLWAPAIRLRDSSPAFVPAAQTYLGFFSAAGESTYTASSNGCAAGRTVRDAVERALLELIERDALAIWWYNQIQRPELDLNQNAEIEAIRAALDEERRTLTLLDISHDLGIPVVVAYTADKGGKGIYFGSAADVSYDQAAVRAASEMLQFWFWGKVSADPAFRKHWLDTESLATQPWLLPSCTTNAAVQAADCSSLADLDPLVVNLTRDRIGVPVVRVVIPELVDHLHALESARLTRVPVDLGWRERKPSADFPCYPCPI